MFADVVADGVLRAHFLCVDRPAVVCVVLDADAGELGLVEGMGEDPVRALCGVIETDAGLELDAGSLDVVIKCRADRADARLYIAAAREQCEIIRGETPDESVWEMLAEEAGNRAQAFVALGDAADGVQPAEIRDVEIDGNFF